MSKSIKKSKTQDPRSSSPIIFDHNPFVTISGSQAFSGYVSNNGSVSIFGSGGGGGAGGGPGGVVGYTTAAYTTSTHNITQPMKSYHVLGTDIICTEYDNELNLRMLISMINVLGISYYVELQKNNIRIEGKIGDFLEDRLQSWFRDQKIENVLS